MRGLAIICGLGFLFASFCALASMAYSENSYTLCGAVGLQGEEPVLEISSSENSLPSAERQFEKYGLEESFLLVDAASGESLIVWGPQIEERVTPCSTFKIVLSLAGFETGILPSIEEPCWPFEESSEEVHPSWRKSQTPHSWMTCSCVWFSERLAERLGQAALAHYLAEFDYGNQDLSGATPAWIASSLAISPREQVAFLSKMVRGELPLSTEAVEKTKSLLAVDTLWGGWKWYGKTGWSGASCETGWCVGWIEREGSCLPFAYLVKSGVCTDRMGRVKALLTEGYLADREECTDLVLPRISPERAAEFYQIIEMVDTLFEERGIPYWLTAGTLLGAVRHQDIIPWDDDVDLAFFEKDLPLLLSLRPCFQERGYDLYIGKDYLKLYPKEGKRVEDEEGNVYPWKYPFVDLFPMTPCEERVVYASNRLRTAFEKDWFPLIDVTRRARAPFGPLALPIPNHAEAYLERLYGSEVWEVAYAEYNHSIERKLSKVKVKLVTHKKSQRSQKEAG